MIRARASNDDCRVLGFRILIQGSGLRATRLKPAGELSVTSYTFSQAVGPICTTEVKQLCWAITFARSEGSMHPTEYILWP